MTSTEQSDSGPVADFALPDALGLCPVHGGEFYMPITLPMSRPWATCPDPGCDRVLRLYVPAEGSCS